MTIRSQDDKDNLRARVAALWFDLYLWVFAKKSHPTLWEAMADLDVHIKESIDTQAELIIERHLAPMIQPHFVHDPQDNSYDRDYEDNLPDDIKALRKQHDIMAVQKMARESDRYHTERKKLQDAIRAMGGEPVKVTP